MVPEGDSRPIRLAVLGSTGSIGSQTLEVAADQPDRISVVLLSARQRLEPLASAITTFRPETAVLTDPTDDDIPALVAGIPLLCGAQAQLDAISSTHPDVVVNGVTGAQGLLASLRTLEEGCTLALANKESMVMAGELMRSTAQKTGARIIPVDSEHSAIDQCLRGGNHGEVARIILTASGGPFRDSSAEEIASATPQQALENPNWEMGL